MATILIGAKKERLKTYSGFIRADVGANEYQYLFIQEIEMAVDDTDVERDRIDDGSPVFTRIGDVLGPFRFLLKNTVDLYQGTTPATDSWLASFWMEQIAQGLFPEIDFIETLNAPESIGNKFARLRWKGRLISAGPDRAKDRGVGEFEVEGEVIGFTSALRQSS